MRENLVLNINIKCMKVDFLFMEDRVRRWVYLSKINQKIEQRMKNV